MRFTIKEASPPELKPGQLWKAITGEVYLAVKAPGAGLENIILLSNLSRHNDSFLSGAGGFGLTDRNDFSYIGELQLER